MKPSNPALIAINVALFASCIVEALAIHAQCVITDDVRQVLIIRGREKENETARAERLVERLDVAESQRDDWRKAALAAIEVCNKSCNKDADFDVPDPRPEPTAPAADKPFPESKALPAPKSRERLCVCGADCRCAPSCSCRRTP